MRLSRAVDLWMGELARAGRTASSRASYERNLHKLIDQIERRKQDATVRDVTTNDCRAFLDNWIGRSPSTVATIHSALNGLFSWLYLESEIDANPMTRVARPRRPRPGDVEVVIVTPRDVERMFAAVETWQELLCLIGARLHGDSSSVREPVCAGGRSIYSEGTIRVREKGNKVSDQAGFERATRDPPRGGRVGRGWLSGGRLRDPESACREVRRNERSDKVIWETVVEAGQCSESR